MAIACASRRVFSRSASISSGMPVFMPVFTMGLTLAPDAPPAFAASPRVNPELPALPISDAAPYARAAAENCTTSCLAARAAIDVFVEADPLEAFAVEATDELGAASVADLNPRGAPRRSEVAVSPFSPSPRAGSPLGMSAARAAVISTTAFRPKPKNPPRSKVRVCRMTASAPRSFFTKASASDMVQA